MKKILIIDDEPDTITFLTNWLEDNGYAACSATDGDMGMQVIQAEKPDLILMDLRMPHRTGFQLYRMLRLNDDFKSIPVIFVTGLPEFQIFDDECTPLPKPEGFIEKPIDLKALHQTIRNILYFQ
ncbi:MAG: response regulator [Acidobacteriota bacterium]